MQACYKRNFNFLAKICNWAGLFEQACLIMDWLEIPKKGFLVTRLYEK